MASDGVRSRETSGALRPTLHRVLLHLQPTARRLEISTDDLRIKRFVNTAYGAHVKRFGDTAAPTDRAQLCTHTSSAEAAFDGIELRLPEPKSARDPWSSGAYIVDQFVWLALSRDEHWLPVYGCAVALGDRAVVLVGPGEVGKTTLALALTLNGARIYGDEMALVHRGTHRVSAVRRELAVREPSLAVLANRRVNAIVRESPVFETAEDRVFFVPAGSLDATAEPVESLPLAAWFVLRRGAESEPSVQPLSTARATLALARYLGKKPGDFDQLLTLAEGLGGIPAFDLRCGDVLRTAELLWKTTPC